MDMIWQLLSASGRDILDRLYETKDFERVVSLLLRTDARAAC